MLVGGEAGVGKSRLVHELIGQARAAGARVLVGGCVQLDGGGIPFAPFVDMLRTLAADLPPDELDTLLGSARAEIGRLVPELDDGRNSAQSGQPDASRILELILGVIGRLASERPLMLLFEDVQWADRSTLDLIAMLVGGVSGRRLLLVFTVRSDELHRAHPFRRMAARWEQQRAVERLDLERLGAGDVSAQIAAILGERPGGELVDFVFERSEGIPLFVEELLGAVRDGRVDHDYLPPSLRDVLLARAEQLSPDAQHVLRAASAAARWVPDRLLAIVAGLPEIKLYAAVREAVEQQLLVVDPSGRGYGFRHALAKAAIHDDLLPGERARLHESYAKALEGTAELAGPDLDATAMLAHHWLAAHDLPRALRATVRAGRAAAGAAAPSAAQRHFELALELWTQVPDAASQASIDHPQLLEAAATAAAQAGAVDRALALVDQALAEVGHQGTPEGRAMLLVRRATILGDLGRDDESLAVLEQAVGSLSSELPSQTGAHVLGQLARALARADHFERAGELARRAVDAAQAVGAIEEKLEAQITVGHSMGYAGELEAGLALLQETATDARGAGLTWTATRTCVNLSDLLTMVARHDDAVATADAGISLAEQAGLARTAGAFLRANKAEALLRSGRWEEAMESSEPGSEAGVFAGVLLLIRAELHTLAGRRSKAESDYREARRQVRNTTAVQFSLPLAWIEAELARSIGDLDGAGKIVERALAQETEGQEQRYRWPVISLGARIEAERALAARDAGCPVPDDVQQRVTALRDQAEGMFGRTLADRGQLALVRAEHARVHRTAETEAWRDAVRACTAMNEAFPRAYALLRYAEALSGDGESAAAGAAAREALDLARRLGALPLEQETEGLIRGARLQTDPSTAPASEPATEVTEELDRLGLTPRELEVLRLVADGRSNSQIADELVISRKTASVHVSNILAKLGVATRVQAAALAHRRGLARASVDA